MQNQTYNVVSDAVLGISLHLLDLNEMQLQCRQVNEYYMCYYCSHDGKTLLNTSCKDSWVPVKQQQLACISAALSIQPGELCITRHITQLLAANIAVMAGLSLLLWQQQSAAAHAPNMHRRQQTKVNRKRYLSERHPTCIAGSRQRSTTGTCQKGTQYASRAADQGQQEEAPVKKAPNIQHRQQTQGQQEEAPVRKAGVAVVRQLIRGSGQQGTAVAASHHRGHHSRLVAALLLQELQVQPGGHRDLVAGLV